MSELKEQTFEKLNTENNNIKEYDDLAEDFMISESKNRKRVIFKWYLQHLNIYINLHYFNMTEDFATFNNYIIFMKKKQTQKLKESSYLY